MIENRVSKLHVIESSSPTIGEDSLLGRIEKFIGDELLDLEGDYEADVQLEQPRSDEHRLGVLTAFEKKAFILGALLEQRIKDMLIEMEANSAEQLSKIVRERGIPFAQAMQEGLGEVPADEREAFNRNTLTHTHLATMLTWSVRHRHNEWTKKIVYRQGFVAYVYG